MQQGRFMFRIWCVNKKQWEEGRTYIDNNGWIYDDLHRVKEETHIIQQCTGLTDCSGNLIYEGDVVRFGLEENDIGVIEWDEGRCRFIIDEKLNNSVSDFDNFYSKELEVIGNICEHEFFKQEE